MKIRIVAQTNIGKEREKNEDAFTFCPDLSSPIWNKDTTETLLSSKGAVVAVVDGMGGANAGEVASWLAIESLKKDFISSDLTTIVASKEKIEAFLQDTVSNADKRINEYMVTHPETIGMGTTIVICWMLSNHAYIAWCGDSRCYVFNPRLGLKALTKDHSYVQELIDKGDLSEEEAMTHPDNNLITRGLGDFDSPAQADIIDYTLQPNDMMLLCSDGLCGYCDNSTIEKVVKSHYHNIDECCDKLIDLAMNVGGFDNICIALASVGDETDSRPSGLKQLFKTLFSGKQV